MSRIFEHGENEHGKCSFLPVGQLNIGSHLYGCDAYVWSMCSIRSTSVCLLYVCAMMDDSEAKHSNVGFADVAITGEV